MQNKFILTDGQKSVNLLASNDPSVWSGLHPQYGTDDITLYSRVAAAYRAYNLKANTVGNMPFTINDLNSGEVVDDSNNWENVVGFMPHPSELLRLNTLSLIATNTFYVLRTSDILNYKTKGLYHAVPYTFTPQVSGDGVNIDYIERHIGTHYEQYQYPYDKRLIRMWRLDHTTELLPSRSTEALAIANAAGVAYAADTWIKHFFERGGVPPTVIAMKGAVTLQKRDEEERSWTEWLLGLGSRFRSRIARVFNADSLDVKQFGSSVTELKDNQVYEQALANIAMGTGMPLSLLMANSANYATAKEEKGTWYENDIIPLCNWIAYGYNEQVFMPLGLFLQFHPETLDPQQEDETARAQAFSIYGDAFAKYPTYDLWRGMVDTLGLEIADTLDKAAQKYYADKEAQAEQVRQQMQQAGVTLTPDGKPVPMQQAQPQAEEPQAEEDTEEPEDDKGGFKMSPDAQSFFAAWVERGKPPLHGTLHSYEAPAKWIPSITQLQELQRWQTLAFRKHKRGEPVSFEWRNDTLPETVYNDIKARLAEDRQWSEDVIKTVFEVAELVAEAEPESDIKTLAKAINRYADVLETQKTHDRQPD